MHQKGFSSRLGFILAAIGSAVGLGNIWAFPYKLADGGLLFLIFYLLLALIVGLPLLIAEINIGKLGGECCYVAYKKISPKLRIVGILSVISPCIVMCYYAVIGGMCIRYLMVNVQYLYSGKTYIDGSLLFIKSTSEIFAAVIYTLLFMFITYFISSKGISSGIERFNKTVIPILLLLLFYLFFKTEPWKNLNDDVLLKVSFKNIKLMDVWHIISSSGEQMFFSLSVSVGTMVTYGAYMSKKQNTFVSALSVVIVDSLVAVLAGLSIISAAALQNSNAGLNGGIGLLFVTMQNLIFGKFGPIFGIAFYLLVILAALSSAVAFIEVPVLSLSTYGIKNRKNTALFCCALISAFAVIISCDGFKNNIMDIWIFVAEGLIIPIAALLSTLYIGWVYGIENLISFKSNTTLKKAFVSHIFRFFAPIMIIIVIIGQIICFLK
ncbi:MAG: sodium-dependent transporter [Clostridia bacterium]|nr:sodium-dependent transporter [Clostridia bacterium]